MVSAAQRAVICTFEKTNPFFGGREGVLAQTAFFILQVQICNWLSLLVHTGVFFDFGTSFCDLRQKNRRRKRGGGGRARIDFVDRSWRRAHGFLFCFECSAACQAFWAVSGVKWLILLGVDGCDC